MRMSPPSISLQPLSIIPMPTPTSSLNAFVATATKAAKAAVAEDKAEETTEA